MSNNSVDQSHKGKERFIVAEITKNWAVGETEADLLSQRFELVINTNLKRGYVLKEWKIFQVISQNVLTETIIAIFKLSTPHNKVG